MVQEDDNGVWDVDNKFTTGGCVQTFPSVKTTGVTKHKRVTEETLDSNGKVTKRVITEEWEYPSQLPGYTGPWNPPYQPVWISDTTQSSDTYQLCNDNKYGVVETGIKASARARPPIPSA